jgi:hypothetical protein
VKRRKRNKLTGGQRFLVGALFAAAFFLVEAGVAEILLANNAQCEAMVSGMRLRFGLQEVCTPEWAVYMLSALSRGIVGLLFPGAPAFFAWLTMGGFYAIAGGGCGQLSPRWGVFIYLAGHISLVALLAGLGYISQFIA